MILKHYITVTEYMLPDGKQEKRQFEVSKEVWDKAELILEEGLRFEFEILRTGEAHFTITDDDEDVSNCVTPNDDTLLPTIEKCILAFDIDAYVDEDDEDDEDEDDDDEDEEVKED